MASRIGFDVSPLAYPLPRGVQRAVTGAVEALESRGVLEVVRLAPTPGTGVELGRWRREELPRLAREHDCAGVHSFLSAMPLRGMGAMG